MEIRKSITDRAEIGKRFVRSLIFINVGKELEKPLRKLPGDELTEAVPLVRGSININLNVARAPVTTSRAVCCDDTLMPSSRS